METRFATYNIEFIETSFSNDHWNFSKTVIVRAYVENKIIAKNTYGYLDVEAVYQKIIKGESINLDSCYVKNFSSIELNKVLNSDGNSFIELENFSAQNAFFDCTLGSDFSLLKFKGGVNFSNSIFSHGNLSFVKSVFYDGPINFKNVEFGNGEINFQYADFGNHNVSFYKSIFYGGLVSFVNATFKNGDVNFSSINFNNSKVKFHFAKFGEGDINFQKTKFGDQTFDCRRVEFGSGKLDFRRATFGDGFVTFDESELKSGKINFKLARFGSNDISFKQVDFSNSELIFENVSFGTGHALFNVSKIKKISFKGSRIDVYLDLRVDTCDTIDLSDTILRDIIDIQPVKEKVAIKVFYLQGMRNLGKFIIDWRKNNVKDLIKSQPDTTLREKAEQFNILKENFHLNGQYEDEDESYIQFKRFEQRADVKDAMELGGKKLVLLPYYVFRWIVFDKMGLYATNPLRVLFSMILIYIMFSLTYMVLPYFNLGTIINSVGATDGLNYLQTSFYHSAITFLTIGYGDYYPTGFSRALSVVEGWMGLFLMSYFTVAFVRKILR
jgi:ion channel